MRKRAGRFSRSSSSRRIDVGAESSAELRFALRNEDDIVTARQNAREVAKRIGFGLVDQSRIATAVSELTRNVIRYATNGQGEIVIQVRSGPRGTGIEILVADQ